MSVRNELWGTPPTEMLYINLGGGGGMATGGKTNRGKNENGKNCIKMT